MNIMADAVEAGKVKTVGVSNYSAEQMRLAHAELTKRGIPLASNQVQYSLLYRKPEVDGVLDACHELGVTLIAYSPLAQGALTGKYSPDTKARIHTLGAFVLFADVAYFSLIAFLRSLNKKLQAYDELSQIRNTNVPENGPLSQKLTRFLFSEIILFRKIVSEVSQNYDRQSPGQNVKGSIAYRVAKIGYILDAYGQKIRRGIVYEICGFLIFLILLVFVPV